ncbi:hypothetical protein BH20ACT8_BH20ACT8_05720 [soil metagenome]
MILVDSNLPTYLVGAEHANSEHLDPRGRLVLRACLGDHAWGLAAVVIGDGVMPV